MVYRNFVKPAADRMAALVMLVLLAPLIALIALLLRVSGTKSVFFVQPRSGQHGRVFRLVKFRTMSDACDENGELLPDEQRITLVGRWLRQTSLDELPQLINVVAGQLSLVGPRPLLPEYLPHYNARQARRHEVRPGITGWAQVNGRNRTTWTERFEFDVWYVDHLSLKLDVYILWKTLICVLRRQDVDAASGGTMPKFTGNPTSV